MPFNHNLKEVKTMKTTMKNQLLSVIMLSAAVVLPGAVMADDFPLHTKLQKCEAAFEKMQSGKLSQAEAWRARKEHKKLTLEILEELNQRNAAVDTATGEVLSNQEILNNFKVMGRLLAMLAADHPSETDEWGYTLE